MTLKNSKKFINSMIGNCVLFQNNLISVAFIEPAVSSSIVSVNDSFAELLEYAVDELEKLSLINLFTSTDYDDIQKEFKNLVEGKNESLSLDTYLLKKNSDLIDCSMRLGTVYNEENEIAAILMVVFDMQDHRTYNDDEKQKMLDNALANLSETQKSLMESEKMASLGGLTAGVAHEINTPIGLGITSMSYFNTITTKLQKDYEEGNVTEEDFEEYIKTAMELSKTVLINLTHASEIVKSFKQVATDQTTDEIREFNIREYIDELLLSMHNKIKKTKHTITIECESDLDIQSYPSAFYHIITNLISNSLDHAYDENDTGNILLKVEKSWDMLIITYTDDGKGIPKENISKIFDPFFTTKRVKGNIGLGLNILYNVVNKQLNGSVECESELGKGVKFTITIPLIMEF